MSPTDWSPDGRFILYNNSALPAVTQGFPSDVFAIDMARGRKVIPLLSTQFFEAGAVFSPDGKWLAFLSDESGRAEIYVQAIATATTTRYASRGNVFSYPVREPNACAGAKTPGSYTT